MSEKGFFLTTVNELSCKKSVMQHQFFTFFSAQQSKFLVTCTMLHPHWRLHQEDSISVTGELLQESNTQFMTLEVDVLYKTSNVHSLSCILLPKNIECSSIIQYFLLEQSWKQSSGLFTQQMPPLEDVQQILSVACFLNLLTSNSMAQALMLHWIEPSQHQYNMALVNYLIGLRLEAAIQIVLHLFINRSDVDPFLCFIEDEQFFLQVLREKTSNGQLNVKQCAEIVSQWLQQRKNSNSAARIVQILDTLQTRPFSDEEKAFLWDQFSPQFLNTGQQSSSTIPSPNDLQEASNQVSKTSTSTQTSSDSIKITVLDQSHFQKRKESKRSREKAMMKPFMSSFQLNQSSSTNSISTNLQQDTEERSKKAQRITKNVLEPEPSNSASSLSENASFDPIDQYLAPYEDESNTFRMEEILIPVNELELLPTVNTEFSEGSSSNNVQNSTKHDR